MGSGLGFLGCAGLGEASLCRKFELVAGESGYVSQSGQSLATWCRSSRPEPLRFVQYQHDQHCLPGNGFSRAKARAPKQMSLTTAHHGSLTSVTENLKLVEMGSSVLGNGILVYFRPTCYQNNQKSHGRLYFPDGRTTLPLTTCPWVSCLFATSH